VSEDILDRARRYLEASREPVAHMDAAFTIIVGLCGEVERLRETERMFKAWEAAQKDREPRFEMSAILIKLIEAQDRIEELEMASPKAGPTKDLREKIEALPRYAFDFSEATVVRDGWLISREAVLALIAGNVPEAPQ